MDWILHLDTHLAALATNHGTLVYLALFAVIFIETGIVVLPFLPGDSLLFVAGALASQYLLSLPTLIPLLVIAAIAGDSLNYAIGAAARKRIKDSSQLHFIKPSHLARTNAFFERHGHKAIVLARFMPIVRTLAPFLAGVGSMRYRFFATYNVVGAIAWVGSLVAAGYAFGNIPAVSENLNAVLLGIIVLSLLPAIVHKILPSKRNI